MIATSLALLLVSEVSAQDFIKTTQYITYSFNAIKYLVNYKLIFRIMLANGNYKYVGDSGYTSLILYDFYIGQISTFQAEILAT
jgi:hypothetical protein